MKAIKVLTVLLQSWKRASVLQQSMWIKVRKRNPNNPLTWASCQRIHLAPHDHFKSCITPRATAGVSVSGGMCHQCALLYKNLLMGEKAGLGGWDVPARPIGPTGAPLFTCPSDQNKSRGCHPSASPFSLNKQIKEGTWHNMVKTLEGGGQATEGEKKNL